MHIPQVAYDAAVRAFKDRPNVSLQDRIEVAVDIAIETAEEEAARQVQRRRAYVG